MANDTINVRFFFFEKEAKNFILEKVAKRIDPFAFSMKVLK